MNLLDSDAEIKVLTATAAAFVTTFCVSTAPDILTFYAHYFAGVMSAVALFVVFDDDE